VLIYGESGTGKELVARAIHLMSRRASGPFVAVNCAALPEQLLESELFGHERGSFTGALTQKKGKFEQAAGGTLFLDEVGELALPTQPKLLRAVQDHVIDRVGGSRSIEVDIRIISATNRDLRTAVAEGKFREDLYYRLNVIPVRTPPLRERLEDIPELARHLVQKHAADAGRVVDGISPKALSILSNYYWPGNIRQLENVVQYAIARGSTHLLLPEDLPDLTESAPLGSDARTFSQMTYDFQRGVLAGAVLRHKTYKRAALSLGIPVKGMHRTLKHFGLRDLLRKDR
jgi:transcriptional regulator with PAS, ATPase and Fis domain